VKPVWLLDIDGVLNVASRRPPRFVWPDGQWIQDRASDGKHTFPMLIARPVVDFLREVHGKGRAEIRWHTTLQHSAKAVADLCGLPDFEVQEAPEYETYFAICDEEWWKLPAVERVIAEGWRRPWRESRATVWTDDDACGRDLPPVELDRLRGIAPLLVIAPQPRLGLTPKHLREIDQFLTEFGDRP
jgi:hypothetical protein